MKKGLRLVLFFLIALEMVGCFTTKAQKGESVSTAQEAPKTSTSKETKQWEWQITKEEAVQKETPLTAEVITPRELKAPEVILPPPVGEKLPVSITFQSADVREVLKVLLGELLNVNYVIDKKVGGELTFRMVGQFYKDEMLNIIQTVLNVHDLALVKRDGLVEVTLLERAKMEPGTLSLGEKIEKKGADIVTQVVPLNYVAPQMLIPALRAFMTPAGIVMAPNDAHAIVVVDKASNIERIVAMIDAFDIPFFAGKAVKFYDIKHVNVDNLAKDLESLVNSLGAPPKGPAAQIGFIPMSDTNKLLVAVANPEMLPTVDFWIKHLDVRSPGEAQLYIYKLQHKKADSMASILNDLFAKEGGLKAPVPGPPGEPGKAAGPVTQAGAVKVIADADSNSLVIKALPQDYQNIRRIIEVMDATPKQVLIEVLIAEVTLDDALSYGVEYFFRNNGTLNEGFAVSLQPTGVTGIGRGTVPPPSPNVTLPGGTKLFLLQKDVDVIINFLAQTTHVEVLSTPRIIVRHEQKAVIQVGSQQPIATSQVQVPIAGGTPQAGATIATQNAIQYKDIGTILTVTPRIGENNMVTMDVTQEVTFIGPSVTIGATGTTFPSFTTRKATTSLVVENGRTIVLGGIIDINNTKSVKRIPVLGSVPLLGNLFKSQDITKKKTELLLVLTPFIVSSPEEADKITKDFENKLKAIERLRSKTAKESVVVQ